MPVSYGQQRLWFLDQLEPGRSLYNVPLALRLTGALHQESLARALNAVVARHEILRSNFALEHGAPVQRIGSPSPVALGWIDLAAASAGAGSHLEQLLREEARRPFRLADEPLIRATLYRVSASEHVLLLNLHHIICDEWSLRVLLRELAICYGALVAGTNPDLPELPIQYADYAVWQREEATERVLAEQLAYWKRQLAGAPPRLELPRDHPGSVADEREQGGAWESLLLPDGLSAGLRELSRKEKVTVFTVLLAAFKVLLVRYTSQTDIVVGSPVSGRNRVETEELIGFFVNTLVLRTDLSGNPTFREALRRVRDVVLTAHEHQDLPFDRLVQEIHPQRSATGIPFLQAVFAYQQVLADEIQLPGITAQIIDVHTGTAKFDLTWVVRECSGRLALCVEFPTRLFERATVRGMMQHWQTLLEGITANPNQPIGQSELLSPAEKRQLLLEWNQTQSDYSAEKTLAALFEAQVQQQPEALALRSGSVELTYAELDRRANAWAQVLRHHGIGPSRCVGVCAERSVDLVVALVAITKAGGAYVPLDPTYPKDRLQLMLEDSGASVVLVQDRWRAALPDVQAQVLSLSEFPPLVGATGLTRVATADDLAYVVYTSGSTGRPKGVLIPQRAVIRLVCRTDYVQLTNQDRVAAASNVAFDAATFEIWGALLNGSVLILLDKDITLSPKDFAAFLVRERITTLFLTTALFNQLAAEVPGAFASLTHLLFGGEAVDPKWVRHVLEHRPPKRLLHVYGPTETTTFATWHLVQQVPPQAQTVPIGRPIANTRVYLLDPYLQPVPVGVCGEIYIGGPGVAHGYLHQAQLTAERFISDPFTQEPGARLYKTGDLGRYRANGEIEFLRRSDQQVKIRGFRVEPGEIEAVLEGHPAVRESVVIVAEGAEGVGKRLVAYVVLKAESGPNALADIQRFLKEKLPAHLVPSLLVPLAALPLNANGKVDRSALPQPDRSRPGLTPGSEAPRTNAEKRLATIWKQVLGLTEVGVRDDFFDLGGHSLLAVRLFSEIEKELGKKLPLASLFQRPTIEALASLVEEKHAAPHWPLLVEIQPQGRKPPVYWIHSLGGDGGGAFFYYRKLAQLLGPDQPSYGIRSPQAPFTAVEEMAACYIRELTTAQPEGPYFLGGYCFGGVVAYEMARQLMEQGRSVGLLALLESAPPCRGRRGLGALRFKGLLTFCSNLRYWLRDAAAHSPGEWVGRLQRKCRSVGRKLWSRVSGAPRSSDASLAELVDMTEYPKDYVRYAQAHWQALQRYVPRPYSGDLTLFRARKQPLLSLDSTLGWGDLARGGVAVKVIPGTHEKMIEEPNVFVLAKELKALLDQAQRPAVETASADACAGAAARPRATPPRQCAIPTGR